MQPTTDAAPLAASEGTNSNSVSAPTTAVKPAKKVKQLDGYVGFANLPNQVYRKAGNFLEKNLSNILFMFKTNYCLSPFIFEVVFCTISV